MLTDKQKIYERLQGGTREWKKATAGDEDLGPLRQLPGVWKNVDDLEGHGWNMIALPFATEPGSPFNYRLLVNQYNETLTFRLVDKGVPNRGIDRAHPSTNTDQLVVTLDYEQSIEQMAADDFPKTDLAGDPGAAIHHEPGLWLYMTNETADGPDIARLATIPHGDAALALGRSKSENGAPQIPDVNSLPVGVSQDFDRNPYLEPYKHFHDDPFQGVFDPVHPSKLLHDANKGVNIKRTTVLEVDTTTASGGISNIPFIVKQANAAEMKSTFWIQELKEKDSKGRPKLRLQYLQVVILDFGPRHDGSPGRIRWPHVSINTMEKTDIDPDEEYRQR